MRIDFNSKPTYGDDDKHIKTKIKIYEDSITTNFYNKKGSKKKNSRRKSTMQMFVNHNSRFCFL